MEAQAILDIIGNTDLLTLRFKAFIDPKFTELDINMNGILTGYKTKVQFVICIRYTQRSGSEIVIQKESMLSLPRPEKAA